MSRSTFYPETVCSYRPNVPDPDPREEPLPVDKDEKQCGGCGHRFYIKEGVWADGWFHVDCPLCRRTLITQTPWFEMRVKDGLQSEEEKDSSDTHDC